MPTTDAGPDLTLPFGSVATLSGSRSGVGTVQWKSLAGPGTVVFSAPSQVATTVTFSQPGHYVLALIVSDDVHAVAYDPIAIDVRLSASAIRDGADLLLEFPPLAGRLYQVEYSTTLAAPWTALVDNLPGTGAVRQVRDAGALNSGRRFYRVQVLP